MKIPSALVAIACLSVIPASAQESAAPFDAPLVTLDQRHRYGLTLDLDNDGWTDAITWWWKSGYVGDVRIEGWRNDGTGKLVFAWGTDVQLVNPSSGPSHSASLRMFACNLDSDGFTDLYFVTHSYQHLNLRALRSRGLIAPEVMTQYSIGWSGSVSSMRAVVNDFTGDGLADVAFTIDGALRLREFVPGQPYVVERSSTYPFGSLNIIKALIAIDANGDATPDLCAISGTSVKLIEVQACAPVATQTFSQGISHDHMPAAGDIDGDGDEDLVIWDMASYSVLRRTGPTNWAVESVVTGGPAEQLFDVDSDGDLDGVCCGGGGTYPTPDNVVPAIMRIAINDGTGAFAPAIEKNWLGSDHLAGIADLDHDGDFDVVSGRCILYARGPLVDELHPPIGTGVKTERATVDYDADGDPDFGFGLRPIERNLGEGLCADDDPAFPATPPGTTFVGPGWPGDFDGDGDTDLVVKLTAGSSLLAQRVLLNLGGGAFVDGGDAGAAGVDFNAGVANADAPEATLALDADGDGDADLLTRSSVPGTRPSTRVWWNDGAGHFVAGPHFPGERVHAVADMNADQLPDLILVDGAAVGLRLGLGAGAFGVRTTFVALEPHAGRLAVADLDADGDLDLAIMDVNYLQVYWNDGFAGFVQQTFTQVSTPANDPTPRRVWSVDADGDGLLDLVVTPARYVPNGVRILLRLPDNSGYAAPIAQIVYDATTGGDGVTTDGIFRDVDGDGDVDFVTDRLVRNATHSNPDGGRRLQTGEGWIGSGDLRPCLGARGPFRVGEPAELRITNAMGGVSGLLTVSWAAQPTVPFSGGGVHAAQQDERIHSIHPFTTTGVAFTQGTGTWNLPYTVPGYSAGRTKRYVATILDPTAPAGEARTNSLLITYGP